HLCPRMAMDGVSVELEPGLREWVEPDSGHTCRLEFSSDWNRARIDRWLMQYLRCRELRRTVFLQTCYPHQGDLGGALGAILYADSGKDHGGRAGMTGSIEFCSVPPLEKARVSWPQPFAKITQTGNGAARFPREGAGLEHELGSSRSLGRIPS